MSLQTLMKLEMMSNFLGDEGIIAICDGISNHGGGFKLLNIADNDITPDTVIQLGSTILNSELKEFSITASELYIDTECFEVFLQCLELSVNLRHINVYEVGGENDTLESAFENCNQIRHEQGIQEFLWTIY